MLKKFSAIFLIVTSWLMMATTSVQADIVIHSTDFSTPGGRDTSPPLSIHRTPTPKYSIPQTISLLKLETIAEHRNGYENPTIGGYFEYQAPQNFFNYFLPLYIIIFALNYAIEYGVGLFFKISKRPCFALMVLLMNLATHPLFTLTLITNFENIANNYTAIILAELLIVLVETLIVWLWLAHKSRIAFITTLIQAGIFCLTLNLASFLIGELIAWITVSSDIIDYYGLCLIVAFIITIIICIFKYPRRKAKPRATL